jgi:hypothetical protein
MKQYFIFILLIISHYVVSGQGKQQDSSAINAKKTTIDQNPYMHFRQLAFSVKPVDLQLTLPTDKAIVYGVIMDWEVDKTIATVVAYQTGDASVYLRSGQMFIGGSGHKSIKETTIEFVSSAQFYLKNSEIASDKSFPDKGCIKFYFLTNVGTFVHQESVQTLNNLKNDWTILFSKGNQIITEYRLFTENKK